MINIVDFIKEEMSKRGMTYDLLAEKAGMSKQNLWDKMNKRVRPNFGNVKKILGGMDYELEIAKKEEKETNLDADMKEVFFEVAEEEQVSYEVIETLLAAVGYKLELKTHKNEENVKKGIDTY